MIRLVQIIMVDAGACLRTARYGFHDSRINDVITDAIDRSGLRIFIIDPENAGVARGLTQIAWRRYE